MSDKPTHLGSVDDPGPWATPDPVEAAKSGPSDATLQRFKAAYDNFEQRVQMFNKAVSDAEQAMTLVASIIGLVRTATEILGPVLDQWAQQEIARRKQEAATPQTPNPLVDLFNKTLAPQLANLPGVFGNLSRLFPLAQPAATGV